MPTEYQLQQLPTSVLRFFSIIAMMARVLRLGLRSSTCRSLWSISLAVLSSTCQSTVQTADYSKNDYLLLLGQQLQLLRGEVELGAGVGGGTAKQENSAAHLCKGTRYEQRNTKVDSTD